MESTLKGGEVLRGFIHIHSAVQDGELALPDLVSLHRSKGYDFICITDHLEKLDSEQFRNMRDLCRAITDDKFVCIYGLEGVHRSGLHILTIGLEEYLDLSIIPLHEMGQEIHKHGGIAVLAHPSLRDIQQVPWKDWDGVEVWNGLKDGWVPNNQLLKALKQLEQINGQCLYRFGGPDAHRISQLFKIETLVRTDVRTREAILQRLREGQFFIRRGHLQLRSTDREILLRYVLMGEVFRFYNPFLKLSGRIAKTLGIKVPEKLLKMLNRIR